VPVPERLYPRGSGPPHPPSLPRNSSTLHPHPPAYHAQHRRPASSMMSAMSESAFLTLRQQPSPRRPRASALPPPLRPLITSPVAVASPGAVSRRRKSRLLRAFLPAALTLQPHALSSPHVLSDRSPSARTRPSLTSHGPWLCFPLLVLPQRAHRSARLMWWTCSCPRRLRSATCRPNLTTLAETRGNGGDDDDDTTTCSRYRRSGSDEKVRLHFR